MYGGNFDAGVDAFNSISRITKGDTIEVADSDYTSPLVWIDENSTDINNPLKVSVISSESFSMESPKDVSRYFLTRRQ